MPLHNAPFWAFLLAGFLLGSIPFALLLGLARGVDIRTVGSKNPGATNLGRALGFRWFLLCFVLDAAKGLAPTLAFGLARGWTGLKSFNLAAPDALLWLAVMATPVLGHMFSPWIGFKGGKGVATGLGALLGVFPALGIPGLGALVVFLATLAGWRYVGLASVLAAASLPVWTWYFFELTARALTKRPEFPGDAPVRFATNPAPFVAVAAALAVLVIVKHRGNLQRLARGTEPKIGRRPAASAPATPAAQPSPPLPPEQAAR